MTAEEEKKNLETICVLAAAAVALGLIFNRDWPLVLALLLLVPGVNSRIFAARVSAAWLAFGALLGKFNTWILLTLIYWLVLTPTALLYRAVKKDPLKLRKLPGGGSYFQDREHAYVKSDLENAW